MIIAGIDPGAGVKSPTGLAIIDTSKKELLQTAAIWPTCDKRAFIRKRILSICGQLDKTISLNMWWNIKRVCIEQFAMRAKGGESLQRLIGALMVTFNNDQEWVQIQNTTVKKIIGGSGRAEKQDVAAGALKWFVDEHSKARIKNLIHDEQWDILDAIAIAIAGSEDV